MYLKGTIEEFEVWHATAKELEGIPPEGKVGYVNGVPAPNNQRTTAYSDAIKHPTEELYVWKAGAYPMGGELLTLEQVKNLGWFPVVE